MGRRNRLCQSVKLGYWRNGLASFETLNLEEGENEVRVEVAWDYFKAWVNGVKFREAIRVDPLRLSSYKHLSIGQSGTCLRVEMERSYVEFPNGEF